MSYEVKAFGLILLVIGMLITVYAMISSSAGWQVSVFGIFLHVIGQVMFWRKVEEPQQREEVGA